jgi:hypothetical protein
LSTLGVVDERLEDGAAAMSAEHDKIGAAIAHILAHELCGVAELDERDERPPCFLGQSQRRQKSGTLYFTRLPEALNVTMQIGQCACTRHLEGMQHDQMRLPIGGNRDGAPLAPDRLARSNRREEHVAHRVVI